MNYAFKGIYVECALPKDLTVASLEWAYRNASVKLADYGVDQSYVSVEFKVTQGGNILLCVSISEHGGYWNITDLTRIGQAVSDVTGFNVSARLQNSMTEIIGPINIERS